MNYKCVKNEDLEDFLSEYNFYDGRCDSMRYSNNRDFIFAFNDELSIVGVATIFNSEKSSLYRLINVVELTNIEVFKEYQNRGIATELLNLTAEYCLENNKILKRSLPTEDGANYILNKFTHILNDKKVDFIPHQFSFIYQIMENKLFTKHNYSNGYKIELVKDVATHMLTNPICIKYNIDSINKVNKNFLDQAYISAEHIVKLVNKKTPYRASSLRI